MAELWDPKPFVVVVVVFKFRFPQQLFYSSELNPKPETTSSSSSAIVVLQLRQFRRLRTAVTRRATRGATNSLVFLLLSSVTHYK